MQVYKEGDRVVNVRLGAVLHVKIYTAARRKRGRGLIWKVHQDLGYYSSFPEALDVVLGTGLPLEGTAIYHAPVPTKESVVLDVLQKYG